MLYLYFAEGLDQVKITLSKFINGLTPFCADDAKQNHQRICFNILDIDRDGELNILNLLNLYKNLEKNTILCREVFMIIDHYMKTNVSSKAD
jgi:Ca2+-binding EF-hand superfamily protein